jgi:hypothetical protein
LRSERLITSLINDVYLLEVGDKIREVPQRGVQQICCDVAFSDYLSQRLLHRYVHTVQATTSHWMVSGPSDKVGTKKSKTCSFMIWNNRLDAPMHRAFVVHPATLAFWFQSKYRLDSEKGGTVTYIFCPDSRS